MTQLRITLERDHLLIGATVGVTRQINALLENARDRSHPDQNPWGTDIESAMAELAVGIVLDRHHTGIVGRSYADVSSFVHVRHTIREDNRLIVRERDPQDEPIVLVTGRAPTFTIHGYIIGRDARREEWRAAPNGGEPAWFVPQEALHDLPDYRNGRPKDQPPAPAGTNTKEPAA